MKRNETKRKQQPRNERKICGIEIRIELNFTLIQVFPISKNAIHIRVVTVLSSVVSKTFQENFTTPFNITFRVK